MAEKRHLSLSSASHMSVHVFLSMHSCVPAHTCAHKHKTKMLSHPKRPVGCSLMCVSFDLDSALFSQASLIPVLSPSRSLCFQSKTVRVFFFNLMVYVRPLHFTSLWCPPAQMHVGYMFIVIDPARMLTAVTLLLTSSTLQDTHS